MLQKSNLHKSVGMSFPTDLLERIDQERHDISRSRFILRLLEMTQWMSENKEGEKGNHHV